MYLASVAVLGLLAMVDRASGDAWIEMTGCEQTVVSGMPFAHVTFSVHNAGSTALYTIVMRSPDPNAIQDSCHTVTLDSPPDWLSNRRPDGGAEWTTPFGINSHIAPGETLGGFGATLSGTLCCFHFLILNAFGDAGGTTHFCFHCDPPTSTFPQTWGYLKATYR